MSRPDAGKRAAELVTVRDNEDGRCVLFIGPEDVAVWGTPHGADFGRKRVIAAIAAALEAHEADLLRWAAGRDAPVGEAREAELREAVTAGRGGPWSTHGADPAALDLLAALDHARAVVLLARSDSGAWADGYAAGRREGRLEMRGECERAAQVAAVNGGGVSVAIVRAVSVAIVRAVSEVRP